MSRAMALSVCGFMVVRRPAENRDALGLGAFPAVVPTLGGVPYGGVDRMPWFDLDERFYAGTASELLQAAKGEIKRTNRDVSGVDVLSDLNLVRRVMDELGADAARNEIIAVYSAELCSLKQTIESPNHLLPLGYDVVIHGAGSALRSGAFEAVGFREWDGRVNINGLLESVDDCQSYAAAYRMWADEVAREPVGTATVDGVRIFKVAD